MKNLFIILFCLLLPFISFAEGEGSIVLNSAEGASVEVYPPSSGIVVYEWFNPECPFVKKVYGGGFMPSVQDEYVGKGVKWYVVNSTNKGHRDFVGVKNRKALKDKMSIKSATMLYDEEGTLGKVLGAKTTPNIFIFKDGELAYSGAVDDSPDTDSDPSKAENNYVKSALDALLSGREVEQKKTRPYGCSVKY